MLQACYGRPGGPLVSPEEFIARASENFRERGILPYCPACLQAVYPYGTLSLNVTSRFDHHPLEGAADPLDDCLLANRTSRFSGMYSEGWDEARGRRLRDEFFEPDNLREAYSFCLKLCRTKNLPASKFRELVARADRKRIWCYQDIPLWTIPYVLLALGNFGDGPNARFAFHFVMVKTMSKPLSQIWQPGERCSIRKVFSSNGQEVRTDDNPFPINKEAMKDKAADTTWVPQRLVDALRIPA